MSLATGNGTAIASQNNFTIRPALTTGVGVEKAHGVPGLTARLVKTYRLRPYRKQWRWRAPIYTKCIPVEATKDFVQRLRQT
jgi:hypothetical protein